MSTTKNYVRPASTPETRDEARRNRPRGGLHQDRRTRRARTRAAANRAAMREDW